MKTAGEPVTRPESCCCPRCTAQTWACQRPLRGPALDPNCKVQKRRFPSKMGCAQIHRLNSNLGRSPRQPTCQTQTRPRTDTHRGRGATSGAPASTSSSTSTEDTKGFKFSARAVDQDLALTRQDLNPLRLLLTLPPTAHGTVRRSGSWVLVWTRSPFADLTLSTMDSTWCEMDFLHPRHNKPPPICGFWVPLSVSL